MEQKAKKKSTINYDRYGYIFIAPFFIVFLIFQLYPIFFTFRTSMTDAVGWNKILNNSIIGFQNYKTLFTANEVSRLFWQSFGNTIIMWLFNFVPQIAMALILASWFTDQHLHLHCQGAFKVLIYMPNIITAATIAMLFFSLFSYPIGPVNTLMQNLGIVNMPFEYFRSVAASRGLISFIQWWMWYGNTMIIMIAGISGINPSLFEAAMVDGGRQFQIFLKIVIPITTPVMMTVALFQIFAYWNSWYPALLYLDSNHTELYPLQYVLVNMQRSIDMLAKDAQYMSGAQAYTPPAVTVRMVLVVLAVLPILVIFPFFQRFVRTGMTVGAVKE